MHEWVKQSAAASGVPAKVKDRGVISALLPLVQTARRTRSLTRRPGGKE